MRWDEKISGNQGKEQTRKQTKQCGCYIAPQSLYIQSYFFSFFDIAIKTNRRCWTREPQADIPRWYVRCGMPMAYSARIFFCCTASRLCGSSGSSGSEWPPLHALFSVLQNALCSIDNFVVGGLGVWAWACAWSGGSNMSAVLPNNPSNHRFWRYVPASFLQYIFTKLLMQGFGWCCCRWWFMAHTESTWHCIIFWKLDVFVCVCLIVKPVEQNNSNKFPSYGLLDITRIMWSCGTFSMFLCSHIYFILYHSLYIYAAEHLVRHTHTFLSHRIAYPKVMLMFLAVCLRRWSRYRTETQKQNKKYGRRSLRRNWWYENKRANGQRETERERERRRER